MSGHGIDALEDAHPLLELLRQQRCVLLAGAPGTGKSTLAARAAAALDVRGQRCYLLGADPGLPAAGLPGAVCLAVWEHGRWQVEASEALCSLDAARFRLPLVGAVGRLLAKCSNRDGPLIVDAPGVVRGAAAAELLPALAVAARAQAAVVLTAADESVPLRDEFHAVGAAVVPLRADPAARRPGRLARERRRTAPWDTHLEHAPDHEFDVDAVAVVGMPPPREAPDAWSGRQIGLLGACGQTLAMGEVLRLDGARLRVRAPSATEPVAALLVRDAQRNGDGLLVTAAPFRKPDEVESPPEGPGEVHRIGAADGPMPVVRTGLYHATLANGVFGDPLLHIRLRHQRRSLLFDLGQAERLPARIAHQITDVFVTHAHFDHIGGFPGLLRTRIGELPACRLYGPPGLAAQVAGMVSGILWDRAGTRAPRFEVTELHGQRLVHHRVIAGEGPARALGSVAADDGVLLAEPGLRVRAVTLDHGTPVLAFAFEPARQLCVRKERLAAHQWPPGPWLGELKRRVLADQRDAVIALPDGNRMAAGMLADELLLVRPGSRLVYATDLADTSANRARLTAFAHAAEVLVCEAPFLQRERAQAARTGHLTARACGEIAAAAGVARLVPFHFSRRHGAERDAIYAEVMEACPAVPVVAIDRARTLRERGAAQA